MLKLTFAVVGRRENPGDIEGGFVTLAPEGGVRDGRIELAPVTDADLNIFQRGGRVDVSFSVHEGPSAAIPDQPAPAFVNKGDGGLAASTTRKAAPSKKSKAAKVPAGGKAKKEASGKK